MSLAEMSIPSLIRNVFIAPPSCPEPVAICFEAAMTLQNTGYFEAAINKLLQGQQQWELVLLQAQFPALVEASSMSTLQRLIADEQDKLAEVEYGLELNLMEKIKRDTAAAAASAAAAAAGGGPPMPPPVLPPAPAPGGAAAGATLSKMSDKEQLEVLRRSRESKLAAKALQAQESASREQQRVQALHKCAELVPLDGKVFVQLSIASVLESSGDDELSLAAGLEALRLIRTMPNFHTTLLAACVYSSLGSVYFHLGQYDLAGDYFFRCLEIREQVMTPRHVDVAQALHNVAAVLLMLRKPSDALALLYRAKAIFDVQLPVTHPRVELAGHNIALARGLLLGDSVPPPMPFAFENVQIPVIPGARRAKEMLAGKKKKKKAPEGGKKK